MCDRLILTIPVKEYLRLLNVDHEVVQWIKTLELSPIDYDHVRLIFDTEDEMISWARIHMKNNILLLTHENYVKTVANSAYQDERIIKIESLTVYQLKSYQNNSDFDIALTFFNEDDKIAWTLAYM